MLKQPDRLAGEGDRSVRKLNGGIAMQEFADGQTTIVVTPDGRRLGVCVWGDPEGAPLFWLHGTPGSRFLREPGDRYLREHLRVFTYDRPGYGLSTRLLVGAWPMRRATYVRSRTRSAWSGLALPGSRAAPRRH